MDMWQRLKILKILAAAGSNTFSCYLIWLRRTISLAFLTTFRWTKVTFCHDPDLYSARIFRTNCRTHANACSSCYVTVWCCLEKFKILLQQQQLSPKAAIFRMLNFLPEGVFCWEVSHRASKSWGLGAKLQTENVGYSFWLSCIFQSV